MESLIEQYSDAVERLRDLSAEIPFWAQAIGLFLLTVVFTAYPMYLLALRRANRGRTEEASSKETLRSKESTLAMLSRFVARGLNDDQYFAAEINPEHPNANEILRMNPLKPESSSGSGVARIQAMPSLEKRLAFCIGCDSASTPYAHEDAERMQRFFDDLGYKTVLLTSKTMTPSTTALALWALQVKHAERQFDTIVVFVAGKLRLVELSRQAFVPEEAAADKPNDAPSERPGVLYLVELLVNERHSTDVKSWVDIHMFAQRLLEATSRQNTDLVLMVDGQYSAEDSQFLLAQPATSEERDAAAYVKQLDYEQLLTQAAGIRHQPIVTLGCTRALSEGVGAGAARKAKYLGSLFVKKIVEAKLSRDKSQSGDADTEAEADAEVVQLPTSDAGSEQAFPTAYGNCRSGLYHCGAMTAESVVVHLRTVWDAAKEGSKPKPGATSSATPSPGEHGESVSQPRPPFWNSNLQRSTLLHSQDALMPRMAFPYPVDSWLAGGCHTADLQRLRTLLHETSKRRADAANVPRSGVVLEVEGSARGIGLSSFLRRFAWGSGEIRRDILYFDLESYALRPPERGSAPRWSFARLVSHLGRTYCNLEHQLPDDSSALEFAKRVLSKIPSTLILDHYSPGTGGPVLEQWLQYLASDSDASSTRLWIVLGVTSGDGKDSASERNGRLTIGADAAFSMKGFLSSPARRIPAEGADDCGVDALATDRQMSMWHWTLLRGLKRELRGSALQSAASVAAAAYGSLQHVEKDLVDYLFRFSNHASAFGCGSLSTTALAAQALNGPVSTWDSTQYLRALSDRGVVEFFAVLEPCSPKESLHSHVRLNWALVKHLTPSSTASNGEGVTALATRIVEQYGKHTTEKTLRVAHDGFFLPRIVAALRWCDAPVERLVQTMKMPPLAASDGTFPVTMRFLAEAMRTRGVLPTIDAFRTNSQRSAQHPLAELPEPILSALECNSTALQTQLNELPQVIFHAVQSSPDNEERFASNFLPGGFWTMPLVRQCFYLNPLQPEKDAPLRAPAVCALCVQNHSTDAEWGTLTAAAFVDAGKGAVLLGFSTGIVALAHLSADASGKAPVSLPVTKLEAGRLSGPVDTIVRHGADRWVTASRTKHEILVWTSEFTVAERVEQLSRPEPTASSSDDEAEKDEGEEDDDGTEVTTVRSMKRALHVHLLTRAMSQYHYDVYLRGAADSDGQGQPGGREPSPVSSPPNIYHIALVSVGRRAGARHPKQHLNDTTAPEHGVFNHVSTAGFDSYRGLATISTPNDRVTITAAGVGPSSDGSARVVVGLSTGDVLVYCLRSLPRGW